MATLQLFVALVNPISSHASRPLFANTQESLWLRPRNFLASSRPVVSRAYRLRSFGTRLFVTPWGLHATPLGGAPMWLV